MNKPTYSAKQMEIQLLLNTMIYKANIVNCSVSSIYRGLSEYSGKVLQQMYWGHMTFSLLFRIIHDFEIILVRKGSFRYASKVKGTDILQFLKKKILGLYINPFVVIMYY